jgi:hypothetical protein
VQRPTTSAKRADRQRNRTRVHSYAREPKKRLPGAGKSAKLGPWSLEVPVSRRERRSASEAGRACVAYVLMKMCSTLDSKSPGPTSRRISGPNSKLYAFYIRTAIRWYFHEFYELQRKGSADANWEQVVANYQGARAAGKKYSSNVRLRANESGPQKINFAD